MMVSSTSTSQPPPETTRYCALCGQCELCMEADERRCPDAVRGRGHVWNGRELH